MLHRRYNEDVKLVIDDNDTSVTYFGDWKTNSSAAAYFKTYGSTIHYTWQPNAKSSISFYGSYITVFGIIPSIYELKNAGITTAGSQIQSSYQFDDGPTEFFDLTLDAYQHFTDQVFFQPNTTQSDGYHTLIITNLVGILTLDYFTIVPANSGSSSYIQKIDDASPNITYNNAKPLSSTSGVDYNSTLHSLPSSQSTASLEFKGIFVAVYCALHPGTSLPVVSFTLDGGDPLVTTGQGDPSGSMPRLPASRKLRLSQVLFWKSSTLANDQHNLLITATQGEFLLDFILIQTDGAGSGTTVPSQSLKPTAPYVSLPSSTNAPYGNTTSSGSTPRSPPTGVSSDHTKNTCVIVGGAVGGVVGFVVLLLAALYMIRILSKRRSGLWSKTQSNTESSSQALIQAGLPAIATPGIPYLVDGSGYGQVLMSFILRPSFTGSVPPPYQPRDEMQEMQVSGEMNEGGKDDVQYGHDDKFAAFGQVQTDQLV